MPAEPSFRARYGPWALVAGAAMGLGAEFARQLAGRGLALVLLDCDAAALEATAASIAAAHAVAVRPVVVDLGRPDLVDALAGSVAGLEIGLLVYNAALGTVAPFLAIDPAHTERMLDVNCRARLRRHRSHVIACRQLRLRAARGLRGHQGVCARARRRALGRAPRARRRRARGAAGRDPDARLGVLAARRPYRGRTTRDGARGGGAGGARRDRHGAQPRRRRAEPESGRSLPAPRAPAGGRGHERDHARAAAELPPRRRLTDQPAA